MSKNIADLEPKSLWSNFADLNAVPRPSKEEERVIEFIKEFGEGLGLETIVDRTGNVLIKKAASKGMEDRKKVIMQSHLDMVHQKNASTNFDFDTEGIKMFIEDDWVKAEGTTLGADNGIGVASIMAILQSKDIPHPAIEALFTIDEETGMTGAFGLQPGFLSGDILLNLDTEDDDELTIGCAGGVNVTAHGSFEQMPLESSTKCFYIQLKGLNGGHSGMDIHKGLGNANKLMNRILNEIYKDFDPDLVEIDGGGLRNAIPRESRAVIDTTESKWSRICSKIDLVFEEIKKEYASTDPNIQIEYGENDKLSWGADADTARKFIDAVYAIPNGIYRMSPTMPGMVQTSNNLAKVSFKQGMYSCLCLCRSSVDSEKMDEVASIKAAFSGLNAKVDADGSYPGWTPAPQSEIVDLMSEMYREMYKEEPNVMACHAGLECGIIGSHYPDLDMVSFGPNIRGAHSPDEKVQISSVQKYWNYLLAVLKEIPVGEVVAEEA